MAESSRPRPSSVFLSNESPLAPYVTCIFNILLCPATLSHLLLNFTFNLISGVFPFTLAPYSLTLFSADFFSPSAFLRDSRIADSFFFASST